MKSDTGAVTLPSADQVGVVVRDVDKTVEFLSSTFGIGPWRIMEVSRSEDEIRVGDGPYKLKLAFAQLGLFELELIQVLEGKTIWSDFLETKGEGLHHIGFHVPNMDELVSKMQQQGVGVLQSGFGQGRGYAYMNPT